MCTIFLLCCFCLFLCTEGGEEHALDVRLSKGHLTRGFESVRVSVISNRTLALDGNSFEHKYASRFRYRWTDKVLNTGIMAVEPGTTSSFIVSGREYTFYVPAKGEGVVGTIIADPCFNNEYLDWCTFGDQFDTLERTPGLLNAIHKHGDTHYWGILGDNFYDQNGAPTATFFSKLSLETQTKLFVTVPGNHDYWLSGTPKRYDQAKDQQANGFMQFYGQDAFASVGSFPYDFSVDPDAVDDGVEEPEPRRRASWSNFHLAQKIGNVGMIGFTGAGRWSEQETQFNEACKALSTEDVDVILVMGHWDIPISDLPNGLEPGMSVEAIHVRLRTLAACRAIPARKFKYVYGHTHCNRMILKDTSYLVAGQGMEGCGVFGFPVFDTTGGQFRVYHFLVQDVHNDVDNYKVIKDCIESSSVTQCYHLAEEWTVVDLAEAE